MLTPQAARHTPRQVSQARSRDFSTGNGGSDARRGARLEGIAKVVKLALPFGPPGAAKAVRSRRFVGGALGLVVIASMALNSSPAWGGGPSWSIVPSPSIGSQDSLNSVSCVSASSCYAVGDYNNGTTNLSLIESWDGTSWKIVSSPNVGPSDSLDSVSCVSASSCNAVGLYGNGTTALTLIESWDGTSWTVQSSPNTGTAENKLTGVSCESADSCTAVGYFDVGNQAEQTLIESWDGTSWNIVSSPNIGSVDYLDSVSCVSATSCMAVGGYYGVQATGQTLIESWDGTSWNIVRSPNSSKRTLNVLFGVSCISASSCKAVGIRRGRVLHSYRTLFESWNGRRWTLRTSPSMGLATNYLESVSCVSVKSCEAVGEDSDRGTYTYRTLVESWNGVSVAIDSSPNTGGYLNYLSGVSCVSASSCMAVGNDTNEGDQQTTLVESFG